MQGYLHTIQMIDRQFYSIFTHFENLYIQGVMQLLFFAWRLSEGLQSCEV